MGVYGFAAISLGAGSGASLRWWLGRRFNTVFPTLPIGILATNLLRGFLVGVAVPFFNKHPALPPQTTLLEIERELGEHGYFAPSCRGWRLGAR
jgi:CrcB protein